eukprot:359841-Chlamydomonas_euryale.AAC.10
MELLLKQTDYVVESMFGYHIQTRPDVSEIDDGVEDPDEPAPAFNTGQGGEAGAQQARNQTRSSRTKVCDIQMYMPFLTAPRSSLLHNPPTTALAEAAWSHLNAWISDTSMMPAGCEPSVAAATAARASTAADTGGVMRPPITGMSFMLLGAADSAISSGWKIIPNGSVNEFETTLDTDGGWEGDERAAALEQSKVLASNPR